MSIFVLVYLAATPPQDVPIQAYVSVPAYMHDMHARDSPVSVHVNFRAAVWLVGFLRYGAPWHIHPHARQFLPRACKRSCWRAGVCLTAAFVLQKTKNRWNFPRKCSSKKRNKTDAWAAQARKEVAPQPRGHLTTRRQLPTASTNAYRHAGDSCIAGTLVFRGRLLEFSPSTLRRSGAGGREGALSAR